MAKVESGNAKPGRKLKRMEFSYKGTSYKFQLNPEEYTQSEPNRVTLTQTKGGAWLDAWGAGIIEISIKGTTGVRGNTTDIDTGYQRFLALRDIFRKINESVVDGEEITDLLEFYNHTDEEYFYCYPKADGFELYRSKSRPNVYQYSISLYALRRIGEAQVTKQQIGNPNKTTSYIGGNSTTTVSQKASYNSGSEPKLVRRSLLSEADETVVTNTKTKANIDLINDARTYCGQLELLIGGNSGKLSPATAYQCCDSITVQESGTVPNVAEFTVSEIIKEASVLYSGLKFTPEVSVETYTLYNGIKNYSEEFLSVAYSGVIGYTNKERLMFAVANSEDYRSTIFKNAKEYQKKAYILKSEFNKIKLVLLESMKVYCDLYNIAKLASPNQDLSITTSMSQMTILIANLKSLSIYLRETSVDYNFLYRTDLIADLRKLEKIMTQIQTDIVDYF